jgi:hypothetical protein
MIEHAIASVEIVQPQIDSDFADFPSYERKDIFHGLKSSPNLIKQTEVQHQALPLSIRKPSRINGMLERPCAAQGKRSSGHIGAGLHAPRQGAPFRFGQAVQGTHVTSYHITDLDCAASVMGLPSANPTWPIRGVRKGQGIDFSLVDLSGPKLHGMDSELWRQQHRTIDYPQKVSAENSSGLHYSAFRRFDPSRSLKIKNLQSRPSAQSPVSGDGPRKGEIQKLPGSMWLATERAATP